MEHFRIPVLYLLRTRTQTCGGRDVLSFFLSFFRYSADGDGAKRRKEA